MTTYLYGKIITPIITKKTRLRILNNQAWIIYPKRRMIGKLTAKKRSFPYGYIGYLGTLEIVINSKKDISKLLTINSIGQKKNEGMGRVKWTKITTKKEEYWKKRKKYNKVKIRKGIPLNLDQEEIKLVHYALLHDLVHTERHRSKIYVEIPLKDQKLLERLRKHHERDTEDKLVQKFQPYDKWAAGITRKVKSPTYSRYNWKAKKKLNFNKLAKEIAEKAINVWELYKYIYNSKELEKITEDMNYGHNTLREHLLIVVNLIINEMVSKTDRNAVGL